MDTVRDFFCKIRKFLWFSKKGRGGLPPSPPVACLVLVELNGSFIGSNLEKGRSFIFGWMFSSFPFRKEYIFHQLALLLMFPLKFNIFLMFDRIYSGPRYPRLWYFMSASIVIWCLAGKITWCFHSYGIFACFSLPSTLIMPFTSRNGHNSFNLPFFLRYFFIVE